MKPVWLALGSNLGDRATNLSRALELLQSDELRLVAASTVRETDSVGLARAPRYLNQAAHFVTTLFPLQLLRRCLAVERALGRRRLGLNSPRTIDIDLIFYASLKMTTRELTLPHPRYHERPFVLEPLRELGYPLS